MAKDYAKVYRGENVMKRGIATYKDEAIFLSQDTLHRDMETLKGRPVVIKHQNVTPENMEEKAVGYVTETFYNNEAGTFGCKFVVFDDEAKELIKNGYGLSTCYKPTSFGAGGTEINTPYDREVTGLNFTHLALVPDPRYEDVKIYENGVMEMEEETLLNGGDGSGDFDHAGNPPHVGGSEPVESRHARGFKSKSERKEVKKEKNNDFDIKKHLEEVRKTHKNFSDETLDYLNGLKTNDKTAYKEVMALVKKYFTTVKYLDKKGLLSKKEEIDRIPDYLNSDLKYTPEGEKLREFAKKHGETYGNLIKTIYELQKKKSQVQNGGDGSGDFDHAGRPGEVGGSEPAGTGREGKYTKSGGQNWVGKKPEQKKLFDEEDKKEAKKEENNIIDFNKKLQEKYNKKEKEIEIDNFSSYKRSIIKEYRGVKENIKKDILAKSNRIDNILKLVDEEIKKGDKYNHAKFYLKDAENLMEEIKEHEKEINYCNKQIQKILKTSEKQNAIIEQERKNAMENEKMEIPVSFFDKVMDLICNSKKEKKNENKEIEDVIEEKEDMEEEKENKCKKNEVVDKRDILRQIMAIAGKHEDNEDVRTIAKLAEKLAYDKDEAEKENSKEEDTEYNNDEFFNALEIAKSLGEADKLPVPETQAKQIERGKKIFG